MRNVINFQRAKVNKNMISASVVQPLMTDQYQITMAYAYWRSGKTNETASFDLFFRKCPFRGEFTIFAGLTECLHFLQEFQFSQSDIEYLQTCFPQCEEEFFQFLLSPSPESESEKETNIVERFTSTTQNENLLDNIRLSDLSSDY